MLATSHVKEIVENEVVQYVHVRIGVCVCVWVWEYECLCMCLYVCTGCVGREHSVRELDCPKERG